MKLYDCEIEDETGLREHVILSSAELVERIAVYIPTWIKEHRKRALRLEGRAILDSHRSWARAVVDNSPVEGYWSAGEWSISWNSR